MAEPALRETETPIWFGHMARGTCRAFRKSSAADRKEGAGKILMEHPPQRGCWSTWEDTAEGERGLTRGLGVKS